MTIDQYEADVHATNLILHLGMVTGALTLSARFDYLVGAMRSGALRAGYVTLLRDTLTRALVASGVEAALVASGVEGADGSIPTSSHESAPPRQEPQQ